MNRQQPVVLDALASALVSFRWVALVLLAVYLLSNITIVQPAGVEVSGPTIARNPHGREQRGEEADVCDHRSDCCCAIGLQHVPSFSAQTPCGNRNRVAS